MSAKLVTIRSYADESQASMAQQILADFGIKSFLAGRNAANIYSGLTAIADIKLQVRKKDAFEAKEILDSLKKEEQ